MAESLKPSRRPVTGKTWMAAAALALACHTLGAHRLTAQATRESTPPVAGRLERPVVQDRGAAGARVQPPSGTAAHQAAGGDGGARLEVPALTSLSEPVLYPVPLEEGDRLVIEVEGDVRGARLDSLGAIPSGALVASFNDGPMFLIGDGRLLWTAPAPGRLAFAVAQDPLERLAGSYDVRIQPIGPRGDGRQTRFPGPVITFSPRTKRSFLEVSYADRSGFDLDRRTLKVILDAAGGERFVLSPYFEVGSSRATLDLSALPAEIRLPPGVHRVSATIGDALGNVAPPAEIFLDEP